MGEGVGGDYGPTTIESHIQLIKQDLDFAIVNQQAELGTLAVRMVREGTRSIEDMQSELGQTEDRLDRRFGVTAIRQELARYESVAEEPEIVG